MFFCNTFAFSMIQWILAIRSLVFVPLKNSACSCWFMHCWTLGWMTLKVKVLVAQSCPTFCDCMDCSSPVLLPWDYPGMNTGVGFHTLLQGIFLIQESNLHLVCLLHWQVCSLPLAPPRKPIWASYYITNITLIPWSQQVINVSSFHFP